jgi:pimeloyl-ACP methyl ester carboxylesterase
MRQHFLRWTLGTIALALATACSHANGAPALPAALPGSNPAAAGALATAGSLNGRGTIISLIHLGTLSKPEMEQGIAGEIIDKVGGKPRCDVQLYVVLYRTIGVHGEPADASAGFFVPLKGCKGPFPLVAFAHGTNLERNQLMSDPATSDPVLTAPDQNPDFIAGIYAGHGYAVAATDYLGLGLSTYPYHPYLDTATEASSVVDAMLAVRAAARQLRVPLAKSTFLAGHSQGGQAALAAQRALEAQSPGAVDLRGTAPSSGPYALAATVADMLRDKTQDAPILAAYMLTGYNKTYANIYTDPAQVFQQPYAKGINRLLPVRTFEQEAALWGTTLPLTLNRLLQPSFLQGALADPQSTVRADIAKNELLGGWKPKTPVYLCGGSRDPEIEFKNTRLAYAYFKAQGANVRLVDVDSLISDVPIAQYHDDVALACLPLARKNFFDPRR